MGATWRDKDVSPCTLTGWGDPQPPWGKLLDKAQAILKPGQGRNVQECRDAICMVLAREDERQYMQTYYPLKYTKAAGWLGEKAKEATFRKRWEKCGRKLDPRFNRISFLHPTPCNYSRPQWSWNWAWKIHDRRMTCA